MEIEIFGAAQEVTGSCFSITTDSGEKILVDCGMFQGSKDMIRRNYDEFGFNPRDYVAMILTHSHLDHSGRIPKLVKEGFRGKIYSTDATRDIASIILLDSAKIAAQDTMNENKRRALENLPPRKPIYNENDVKTAMRLFKTAEYDEDIHITENITARLYNAGHILGASSILLTVKEGRKKKTVAFSGDLGQKDAIIVKNAEPIKKADWVFVEATYGDRLHPPIAERRNELLRVIKKVYKKGGKLMIPSFAVERAQEILYLIGQFKKEGLMPEETVYLDSPMAIKATEVFTKYAKYYNSGISGSIEKGEDPFSFPGLVITPTVEESKKINDETDPCIIIAGNGMCTGGRIKHHIKNNIQDKKNFLLFIGYQAKDLLGYWIEKGEKNIRLLGTVVPVNAEIGSIEGFSAHADYKGLVSWLENFSPKPKKIFIIHGEEKASVAFENRLKKMKFITQIPSMNEKIRL